MHLTRLASLHRLTPQTSLLVNALSGAVDLVGNRARSQLLELALGREPALAEQLRQSLVERGYLYADEGEERAALNRIYKMYQEVSASRPFQLIVSPTYTCNLDCSYCFQSSQLRARPQVMRLQQVAHLFLAAEQFTASWPGRDRQLVLFGGEPLLPTTEGVVREMVKQAEDARLTVRVVTNGIHLPRFVPLLRQHRAIVRGIQVTLDGPQPVHDARRKAANGRGSFSAVVHGVEACLEAELPLSLRVNLDAHNIGSLEALADLLRDRGWAGRKGFRCQLAPVTDHLGTSRYPFTMREDELVEPVLALWRRRPELKQALDFRLFRVLDHLISVIEPGRPSRTLPRFHYCEADRGDILAFGPDGLIYVCPESAGTARYAVGTYSPRYRLWPRRLRKWEARSVLALPECQSCNIATFCGGGCGYAALRRFGSLHHGVCAGAPQVFKAYTEVLRERLQNEQVLLTA